jgi:hypothetical protein
MPQKALRVTVYKEGVKWTGPIPRTCILCERDGGCKAHPRLTTDKHVKDQEPENFGGDDHDPIQILYRALLKYGNHLPGCKQLNTFVPSTCSCGFREAIAI